MKLRKGILEKIKTLREYREKQYQLLCDAVYERKGWDENGVPTLDTIRKLQIDFPEVVALWQNYNNNK